MADALLEYVQDNFLSKENILRVIDDYSIYSFYIGAELELRTKYSSPLREGDNDPSFSLFYSKYLDDVILFKDNATGNSGNVFDFLELYLNLPSKEVLCQINSDFGLGFNGQEMGNFKPHLVKSKPLKKHPKEIKVVLNDPPTKEFLEYWQRLDISEQTRDLYYARNPRVIHYNSPDGNIIIVARTLTISYEILGKYKIYHPFEDKKLKFRNNYLDNFVEGALQLTFQKSFAIITKATKECMFFREHFDWDSVAGKSETTPISLYFMENVLKVKYETVFIWLDPDKSGITSQENYLKNYPWLVPIAFDSSISDKDPTDFYDRMKREGKAQEALKIIKNLITKHLE